MHKNHKLRPVEMAEYSTDDFDGRPLCRLRFGAATRLFYFSLPFFHALDPRTTRIPVKVHAIFRPTFERWVRISSEELSCDVRYKENPAVKSTSKIFSINA
jgi:hypothetical protein